MNYRRYQPGILETVTTGLFLRRHNTYENHKKRRCMSVCVGTNTFLTYYCRRVGRRTRKMRMLA
jgi:hypothetical protein